MTYSRSQSLPTWKAEPGKLARFVPDEKIMGLIPLDDIGMTPGSIVTIERVDGSRVSVLGRDGLWWIDSFCDPEFVCPFTVGDEVELDPDSDALRESISASFYGLEKHKKYVIREILNSSYIYFVDPFPGRRFRWFFFRKKEA